MDSRARTTLPVAEELNITFFAESVVFSGEFPISYESYKGKPYQTKTSALCVREKIEDLKTWESMIDESYTSHQLS